MLRKIILISLLVSGVATAKAKRFMDSLGHTLTVGQESVGIVFWIIEDGRSAETGPTLKKSEAAGLSNTLDVCWRHRGENFRSGQTFWGDDWLQVVCEKNGLICTTGDKKHTAKSFRITDEQTLKAIMNELKSAPSSGSVGAPGPSYPTHK